MVVRVLTYEAECLEAAEAWAREHGEDLREVPGIERVLFIRSAVPPQAGVVMVFESDAALARYRTTGPHERLVEGLQQAWADEGPAVRDETYWVMEV